MWPYSALALGDSYCGNMSEQKHTHLDAHAHTSTAPLLPVLMGNLSNDISFC